MTKKNETSNNWVLLYSSKSLEYEIIIPTILSLPVAQRAELLRKNPEVIKARHTDTT